MPVLEQTRAISYPEIEDLGEVNEESDTEEGAVDAADEDRSQVAGQEPEGSLLEASEDARLGEEKAAEATAEAKSEDVADAKPDEGPDKARLFDDFQEQFARDPAAFVAKLMGGLTPQQLAALGVTQAQPEPAAAWEAQSDGEEWLQKQVPVIEALPAFARNVEQQFQIRDAYVNDALIDNAILREQVDALATLLDAKLPDVDRAAIQKELLSGKVGYRDAVKKLYKPGLDTAVTQKKKLAEQAAKPRPRTPGNTGGDAIQVKPGMSMAEIMRLQTQ